MAPDENIAAIPVNPTVLDPNRMRARRPNPFTFVPYITFAHPLVIAIGPDIAGSRSETYGSDANSRGRSNSHYNLGRTRGSYT